MDFQKTSRNKDAVGKLPSPVLAAAFFTAMEALGTPAYLLDGAGRLVHANTMGLSARLSLKKLETQRVISTDGDLLVVPIVNALDHRLLVKRGCGRNFGSCLAHAVGQWSLTPKQHQVLELLLRGLSNKEIARELHCVKGTVELHVTALLRKAQVDSRGRLFARFWGVEWTAPADS